MAFEAHPVTAERWPDLVELFDRPVARTHFCMYDRAGFREVARRRPTRPVVRKALRPGR